MARDIVGRAKPPQEKSMTKYFIVSTLFCALLGSVMGSNAYAANIGLALPVVPQRTASISLLTAINQKNQAVGFGNTALQWDRGWQTDVLPQRYWSEASTINNNGVIGGITATRAEVGRWPGQAFLLYPDRGFVALDAGNRPWSMVHALNDRNEAVGVGVTLKADGSAQDVDALQWTATGSVVSLPKLAATKPTVALAINNATSAVVVGAAQDAVGIYHAVRWLDGKTIIDLNIPASTNGAHSFATAVNDQGQIVGWSGALPLVPNGAGFVASRDPDSVPNAPSEWLYSFLQASGQGFLWDATNGMTSLPALPGYRSSVPLGINNHGVVVGFVESTNGQQRAFIYEPGKGMSLLSEHFSSVATPSSLEIQMATAINDAGVVTAFGRLTVASELQPLVLVPAGGDKFGAMTTSVQMPNSAHVGDKIDIKILAGNAGIDTVKASVEVVLAEGLALLSVPPNCQQNVRLTCELGPLAPSSSGSSAVVTLNAEVKRAGRSLVQAFTHSDGLEMNDATASHSGELLVQADPPAAPTYDITDLGPLNGWNGSSAFDPAYVQPFGLNDNGTVVGRAMSSSFVYNATKWTLYGPSCPNAQLTCKVNQHWQELSAINNSGLAIGMRHVGVDSSNLALGQAFMLDDKGNESLLPLTPSFAGFHYARDINSHGDIVGHGAADPAPTTKAFLWNVQRGVTLIPGLGDGDVYALGLNDDGIVVGAAKNAAGEFRAFRWRADTGAAPLAVLAQQESFAVDINSREQIVGWLGDEPQRTDLSLMFGTNPNAGPSAWYYSALQANGDAYVLDGAEVLQLGPGVALSINDAGYAVGYLRDAHNISVDHTLLNPRYTEKQRAFVYDTQARVLLDLNTRLTQADDWQLRVAQRINNQGQIIGWGERSNDVANGSNRTRLHGFLLTPVTASPTPSIRFMLPATGSVLTRELNGPVTLAFTVSNWPLSATGNHIHWFVDAVQQAQHFDMTPFDLSNLPDGVHALRAVLAEADHSETASDAEVSIELKTLVPVVPIAEPAGGTVAAPATGGSSGGGGGLFPMLTLAWLFLMWLVRCRQFGGSARRSLSIK